MEKQNNSGVFFKNDRKESEKHPDYTGTVVVDGKDYRIAVWNRVSQGGREYHSVAFTPIEAQNNSTPGDLPC